MKKKIAILLATMLAICTLAGCGHDIKEYHCYTLLDAYTGEEYLEDIYEYGYYMTLEVDRGNVYTMTIVYNDETTTRNGTLEYDGVGYYDVYDVDGDPLDLYIEFDEENAIVYSTKDSAVYLIFGNTY